MMPNMDGFATCQEIRKRSDVPIVMLTARGSVEDIVRGFELGADDYITKPFVFKELEARIQAILRRVDWGEPKPTRTIGIGRVWIASNTHEVRVDDAQVHLTPIEFQLLYYLMSNAGQAISKDTLFRKVWGYDFVGGTNLVTTTVPPSTTNTPYQYTSHYVSENAYDDPFNPAASGYPNDVWGSGGGVSTYYSKPFYQYLVNTRNATQRTIPDISMHMGGCPFGAILAGPGSFVNNTSTCATIAATGSCTVQITSATTGTTVVNASTDVQIAPVTVHSFGPCIAR